jgi:glutaminase
MDFQKIVDDVYNKTKHIKGGKKADYIPELKKVKSSIFSISLCDLSGNVYHKGDYKNKVAIESISKLFSLSLAIRKHGTKTVFNKIGMHGSFLPFNSIIAAKLAPSHTINPFLNQGAMATTSLLYNKNSKKYKKSLLDNMCEFASTKLSVGNNIYKSESETNTVNMSLAYLLKNNNRFYGPVGECVDAYTYQCSVKVSSDDLARMASVYANGGVNPTTNKRILSKKEAEYILNNLLPEGLYEYSDEWIAKTGGNAYAKSGVGGGILIVIPGVCGIGIISPRLDKHGNSQRGVSAGIKLSRKLSKNIFDRCGRVVNKKDSKKTNSKTTRKTKSEKKNKTTRKTKSKKNNKTRKIK